MHYLLDWKVLWVCINLAAVKMALKPLKCPGKSLYLAAEVFSVPILRTCCTDTDGAGNFITCSVLSGSNQLITFSPSTSVSIFSTHKLANGGGRGRKQQVLWGENLGADREDFTGGFVRILLGVWERQSDGGKCLQTLQLSMMCKAGGNQESLVLEQLIVFRFCFSVSFWKCWFLPGVRSWPLGNLDVIFSLPCCSLGALSVQHWGECKMGKHSPNFSWMWRSAEALVLVCKFKSAGAQAFPSIQSIFRLLYKCWAIFTIS